MPFPIWPIILALHLQWVHPLFLCHAIHDLTHRTCSASLGSMSFIPLPCHLWSDPLYCSAPSASVSFILLLCHLWSDPSYLLSIFRKYVLYLFAVPFVIWSIVPALHLQTVCPWSLCLAICDLTHCTCSASSGGMSFILLLCHLWSDLLYLLCISRLYALYPFAICDLIMVLVLHLQHVCTSFPYHIIHDLTHCTCSAPSVCFSYLSCHVICNLTHCIYSVSSGGMSFILLSHHSWFYPSYSLFIFSLYALFSFATPFTIWPITLFLHLQMVCLFSLCYASHDLTHHTHSAPSECMFFLLLHGLWSDPILLALLPLVCGYISFFIGFHDLTMIYFISGHVSISPLVLLLLSYSITCLYLLRKCVIQMYVIDFNLTILGFSVALECKYFWCHSFFHDLILELTYFFSARKCVGPGIAAMFIISSYSTCSNFSASMLFISMQLLLCFLLPVSYFLFDFRKYVVVLLIWACNLTPCLLSFLEGKSTFCSSYSIKHIVIILCFQEVHYLFFILIHDGILIPVSRKPRLIWNRRLLMICMMSPVKWEDKLWISCGKVWFSQGEVCFSQGKVCFSQGKFSQDQAR